jgi:hypothetical protein
LKSVILFTSIMESDCERYVMDMSQCEFISPLSVALALLSCPEINVHAHLLWILRFHCLLH